MLEVIRVMGSKRSVSCIKIDNSNLFTKPYLRQVLKISGKSGERRNHQKTYITPKVHYLPFAKQIWQPISSFLITTIQDLQDFRILVHILKNP
jgi:hypothetical protein